MAGPLLPLAIGLSAASSIPNWVAAFNQNKQAKELESGLSRPGFEIPQGAQDALSSAENQAQMTRLPGASAMEGQIEQSTANSIDAIERLGPGGATSINAAGMAYGNEQNKKTQLGIAGSEMWLRNQDILRNEQNRMGEWQNRAWEWDKAQPYIAKTDAIRSLKEGSMRNYDNAFKDLFGGAANIALGAYLGGKGPGDWSKLFGTEETNAVPIDPNTGEAITDLNTNSISAPSVETDVQGSTQEGSNGSWNNWLWNFNKNSPIMNLLMPK
jgi:hypothetical protein